MRSLFTSSSLEPLNLPNAEVSYLDAMPLAATPEAILARLLEEIRWEHKDIFIKGRAIKQPRLTAWYGEADAAYTYSGLKNQPLPWSPLLLELKGQVEELTGTSFNSALLNLYRHNRDSIGFHSDDEPELGPNPTIASLSFGQERTFILRSKWDKSLSPRKIKLPSGSLLVMAGPTQEHWVHGIEKERDLCEPRVNITFRTIHSKTPPRRRFSR